MVRLQSFEEAGMDPKAITLKHLLLSIGILLLTEAARSAMIRQLNISPLFILGGIRSIQIILILQIFSGNVPIGGIHTTLQSLGLAPSQIISGLRNGLLWSFGFGVVVLIGFGVLYAMELDPIRMLHFRLPAQGTDRILFFVVGGIIAPVAEEIVFRGVLFGYLRRWGALPAILISTAVFSLAHAGVSPVQAIGGIVFAISYEIEKKMMVPITVHALGNLALFSLSAFF